MVRKRILFVDNDRDFLITRARFLEKEGYHVTKANTIAEAESGLRTELFHLAIIDIRLIDNDEPQDESGLELARREEFRTIPKIILTNFPTFGAMRSMMRQVKNAAPAVDYVYKKDGQKVLLAAVAEAFANAVHVNWQLVIQSVNDHPVTLLQLVALLIGSLDDEHLLLKAEELEDLFRRLFTRHQHIVINRLLWQRARRLAVEVFAFDERGLREEFIVTCGSKAAILREQECYYEAAPKQSNGSTPAWRLLAETVNFGANLYCPVGFDLEASIPLKEVYRQSPERTFYTVLQTLSEQVWPEWHRNQKLLDEQLTLRQIYCEKLGLSDSSSVAAGLGQCIRYLSHQAPKLGVRIEVNAESISWHFAAQSYSYANPVAVFNMDDDAEKTAVKINLPGYLSGVNILVAKNNRLCLTDFDAAGLWPLLHSFVAMEMVIRFDFMEADKLHWLLDMEQRLGEDSFSRFDITEVEPPLRKSMRAIQHLRRLADQTEGRDWQAYQSGIFLNLISRLWQQWENGSIHQASLRDLLRYMHALLAASMIGSRLRESAPASRPAADDLYLDRATYTVWVDGASVHLNGMIYNLFSYLYERANQICSRRELIEAIFEERYSEDNASQDGKLNTAISRLREKIEANPNKPRFLATEPGRGYRLVVRDSSGPR